MYTVDEQLIVSGRSYLATMMSVLSTILVVASVTPVFILGLAPVVVFYLHQQSFFTMTYRELKRLDVSNMLLPTEQPDFSDAFWAKVRFETIALDPESVAKPVSQVSEHAAK